VQLFIRAGPKLQRLSTSAQLAMTAQQLPVILCSEVNAVIKALCDNAIQVTVAVASHMLMQDQRLKIGVNREE